MMEWRNTVLKIFVDADACPVKAEIFKVALRYKLSVFVVSNAAIAVPRHQLIESIVVPGGFNSADDWIVDQVSQMDIVITEDIPLAGRCIEKAAKVIGTRGNVFTETAIGESLASRELFSQLRDQGVISGGPSPFRDQDRSKFLQRLDQTINEVMKLSRRLK